MFFFYHVPTDEINIFTPNTYLNMYIRNISVYADRVDIHLSGHELVVLIDRKG